MLSRILRVPYITCAQLVARSWNSSSWCRAAVSTREIVRATNFLIFQVYTEIRRMAGTGEGMGGYRDETRRDEAPQTSSQSHSWASAAQYLRNPKGVEKERMMSKRGRKKESRQKKKKEKIQEKKILKRIVFSFLIFLHLISSYILFFFLSIFFVQFSHLIIPGYINYKFSQENTETLCGKNNIQR